jgi:signal transduction histidine kinase
VIRSSRRSDLQVGGAGIVVALTLALLWGRGGRDIVSSLLVGSALATARRLPRLTWACVAAVTLAFGAAGQFVGDDETVALVLLAAHGFFSGRWDRHWRGLGGPIALTVAGEIVAFDQGTSRGAFAFFIVMAWLGGRAVRQHEQLATSLALRNAELADEQETHAELSVRYERARIAGELHDLVAHAISVMVIQAGAGQRLAGTDPQRSREAFQAIAGAAREAESDLGRLVALLGDRETATSSPDLELVEELIERAAASGLDVRLRLEGDPDGLPGPLLALTHRVVQEGITNALRYASGAPVGVLVRAVPDALLVEVENAPARAASPLAGAGTGNGLRGLRERASELGGTIAAGPAAGGGWRLAARVPR